jgi:hypothetical protein
LTHKKAFVFQFYLFCAKRNALQKLVLQDTDFNSKNGIAAERHILTGSA